MTDFCWNQLEADHGAAARLNDMIANLAVLLAAIGVFGTKAGWPDIAVASIMAVLGLSGARDIIGRARSELRGLSTSTS